MTRSQNSVYGVPYGDATTAMSKFFQQLGNAGETVIHQLKTDPSYTRRLAKYAMAGTYGKPTVMGRARAIMRENFISPESVEHAIACKYTPLAMNGFEQVLFSEEDLLSVCETHLLVPGVNLTIDQLYERTKMNLHYMWDPKTWCWKGPHASKEIVGTNWILIRKGEVPGSFGRSWDEQQGIISYKEIVPRACELFFAMVIFKLTQEKGVEFMPESGRYNDLRCSDQGRNKWWIKIPRHVSVHDCVGSIHPNNDTYDTPDPRVGLASRWRLLSEI